MNQTGISVICSTGSFWMWELERTFGAMAAAGFTDVELMVTRDPRTQNPEIVGRMAAREGLSIVAVHAPMLVATRSVWGPGFQPIITRSVELAQRVGAGVVIIHPPYIWEVRYQRWLIGESDSVSAESGVSIAVENMFRLWVRGRPIRGHRWVSPSDLDRFAQITLDTSHCGVDDYDIIEALERIGGRLRHVHISDNRGTHRDSHALPGAGILPLDRFVKELAGTGFQGALSLELDLREQVDNQQAVTEALSSSRDFCLENLN